MIGVAIKSLTVVALSLLFVFAGCDNGCDKENPSVILTNNGTEKADIKIKTSGGNTENINNIQPGASSEKRTFAPGEIKFTVNIQGVQDPVEYLLLANYCNTYTVSINEDNTVTGSGCKLEKSSIL